MQHSPSGIKVDTLKHLESALDDRNSEWLDSILAQSAGALHFMDASILIRLAEAPWHQRHEDVVFALQGLRSPEAVNALERTAFSKHEYLAYDNSHALARKCTWALADIGTPEAHQALTRIASCSDETIAGYARKRLDNWQLELPRKGNS